MIPDHFTAPHQRREGEAPAAPAGSRIYAIGDVHGRADLLREMHRLIHADAYRRQAPRNVVVYLGDYIDRGRQSPEVLDILLNEALPSFESIYLKGNHEESLLRFLDDISIGPAWLYYGGAETLESYGVTTPQSPHDPRTLTRAQRELQRRLPDSHRNFMASLRLLHAEGDYLFVHAGIRPGVPLQQQDPEDLLWIRDSFLDSDAEHGCIVVHGHTITERPDVQRNRIGIDTGAFATDRLTCLILEGTDWSFLQT
jgi:diadenosine tetraphosphatase ApaH/serine/threonine PP2A family protein phosphatase